MKRYKIVIISEVSKMTSQTLRADTRNATERQASLTEKPAGVSVPANYYSELLFNDVFLSKHL